MYTPLPPGCQNRFTGRTTSNRWRAAIVFVDVTREDVERLNVVCKDRSFSKPRETEGNHFFSVSRGLLFVRNIGRSVVTCREQSALCSYFHNPIQKKKSTTTFFSTCRSVICVRTPDEKCDFDRRVFGLVDRTMYVSYQDLVVAP